MSNIDKFVILVLWGCRNNHRQVAYTTNTFLPVLKAGKSKKKALADLVSDEDLLPLHGPQPCHGEGA